MAAIHIFRRLFQAWDAVLDSLLGAGASPGDVPEWDGTEWVPVPGGGGGTTNHAALTNLQWNKCLHFGAFDGFASFTAGGATAFVSTFAQASAVLSHDLLIAGGLIWDASAHTAPAGDRFAGFTAGGVAQSFTLSEVGALVVHSTLAGLTWIGSGHTGAGPFAAFSGGVASELTASAAAALLDHAQIGAGIGVNTHPTIDNHLASTANPHAVTLAQVGGTLDHTALSNIGIQTHPALDAHVADVTTNPHAVTLGQVGGTLDHTALINIGTNSHPTIDTHLANTSNPHAVTLAQVGGTTDHAALDAPSLVWTGGGHTDAPFTFAAFGGGGLAEVMSLAALEALIDHSNLGLGLTWIGSGHLGAGPFAAFSGGVASELTAAAASALLSHDLTLAAGLVWDDSAHTAPASDNFAGFLAGVAMSLNPVQAANLLDHDDLAALAWTGSGHSAPAADRFAGFTTGAAESFTPVEAAALLSHVDLGAGLAWIGGGHTGTGPFAAFSGGVASELTAVQAAALLDHDDLIPASLDWETSGHDASGNQRAGFDSAGDAVEMGPGLSLIENTTITNTTGLQIPWTYDLTADTVDFDLEFGTGTNSIICLFDGFVMVNATISIQTAVFAGALTVVGLMNTSGGTAQPFTTYGNLGWSGAGGQVTFSAGPFLVSALDVIDFELYAGGAGTFNVIERRASFVRVG